MRQEFAKKFAKKLGNYSLHVFGNIVNMDKITKRSLGQRLWLVEGGKSSGGKSIFD